MNKSFILKRLIVTIIIAAAFITALFLCSACNVTRTITTESQCYQRGDTSVMIVSKTIETYDASRK